MYVLGREWARGGHDVIHISRQFEGLPNEEVLDQVKHVRIRSSDAPKSPYLFRLRELIYCVRALRRLPMADIIMTHSVILPLLIRNPQFGALCIYSARYPKGQMRLYRHSARICATSQAVAQAIEEQTPQICNKMSTIHIPLAEEFTHSDLAGVNAKRARQVLYLGRLHPEKGVKLAIEAFSRASLNGNSDWKLTIVGPSEARLGGGGNDYLQELKRAAEPCANQVEFVGPVFDANQIVNHYRSASVFVYPSLAEKGEALGMSPIEAMSQGCVPIVSALDCFRDYLEPGVNGLVFDHRAADPADALAKAMAKLIAPDAPLAPMRHKAIETAQRFSVAEIAQRHIEDFQTLIGQ